MASNNRQSYDNIYVINQYGGREAIRMSNDILTSILDYSNAIIDESHEIANDIQEQMLTKIKQVTPVRKYSTNTQVVKRIIVHRSPPAVPKAIRQEKAAKYQPGMTRKSWKRLTTHNLEGMYSFGGGTHSILQSTIGTNIRSAQTPRTIYAVRNTARWSIIHLLNFGHDTIVEATDNTVKHMGETEEAAKNSLDNIGKTSADVVDEIKTRKKAEAEEALKSRVEELDHKLNVHKVSEEEYYASLRNILDEEKGWLEEDSELWHSYNDNYTSYMEKASEEERNAIKKMADEEAKAIKEAQDKKKEDTAKAWAAAEREQQEKGYDDEWLLNEYQKILDTLEEGSDLYLEYYDKWLKLRNDIQDDDIKEWESSAKETSDAIKNAYQKAQNALEEAQKNYLKTGSELWDNVTDKNGNERLVLKDLII